VVVAVKWHCLPERASWGLLMGVPDLASGTPNSAYRPDNPSIIKRQIVCDHTCHRAVTNLCNKMASDVVLQVH